MKAFYFSPFGKHWVNKHLYFQVIQKERTKNVKQKSSHKL